MNPPSTSSQHPIHLLIDGKTTGPFTREEVLAMLSGDEVSPHTKAWREDLPGWMPLSEVLNPPTVLPAPTAPGTEGSRPKPAKIGAEEVIMLTLLGAAGLLLMLWVGNSSADDAGGRALGAGGIVVLLAAFWLAPVPVAMMIIGAIVAGWFAMFYSIGHEGVVNMGLMNNRLIGVIVGIGIAGIGAVLYLKKKFWAAGAAAARGRALSPREDRPAVAG